MTREAFIYRLFVCKNVYTWCEFSEMTGCYFIVPKVDVLKQLKQHPYVEDIDAYEYDENLWIG